MKKFIKTIVSLTAASAMLLSTTAFAATTQTVTKYKDDGLEVTSKISGLKENSMVTYLAVKGKDQAVSENGDNIVYIGQKNVPNTGSVDFGYKISDTKVGAGVYATVKCGSSVDTIENTNTIEVGGVTVTWDKNGVPGTAVTDMLVGEGDEVSLTLVPADGSEIVKIVKNNKEELDPFNKTVKATAGDNFVVSAVPTTGDTAAVYQLVGAKVDLDENYTYEKETEKGIEKVYTNSGIVRVIGEVKSVKFVFEDANGETYEMNKGTADAKSEFEVTGLSENGGYYGVEIEDTTDISNLSVTATAVGDTDEVGVHKIFE